MIFTRQEEDGYSSGGICHLEVVERFRSEEPWMSELASEIPGYQALIEAAEFARLRCAETIQELHRERLPAALAIITAGQEYCLGKFGISRNNFRYDDETIRWDDLRYVHLDKEELVVSATGNRAFAYDSLTFAERWLLQLVAQLANYDHDHPDEEGEDDDEEPGTEERE